MRGLADVLPLNANVADEPTNRRISVLVLNKSADRSAERAFFRDGGRTSIDESLPASEAVPGVVAKIKVVASSAN